MFYAFVYEEKIKIVEINPQAPILMTPLLNL